MTLNVSLLAGLMPLMTGLENPALAASSLPSDDCLPAYWLGRPRTLTRSEVGAGEA